MKRINRRKMDDSSTHEVWRSYSDMMSGLLLLFVLIMAVCLMQAQKNYTEKLAEQAKQLQTLSQLEESQNQVEDQQTMLAEQESELAEQEATLAEQASVLEQLQKALEQQQLDLSTKESEVEAQNLLLMQQESELALQEEALALSREQLDEANELMIAQQNRIDQIIGVKAELIETLNDEFRRNNLNVLIDMETGAILLESSVLFAFNEYDLTEDGMAYLDQVLPIYCQVLLSGDYIDYVAEIIVDGYTDSVGDYITNLDLSQRRAYAVAAYLYEHMYDFMSPEDSEILLSKLTANGKSTSNPILTETGERDDDASRRVEIKFRLKDEEMLSELQEIIAQSQQDMVTVNAEQ